MTNLEVDWSSTLVIKVLVTEVLVTKVLVTKQLIIKLLVIVLLLIDVLVASMSLQAAYSSTCLQVHLRILLTEDNMIELSNLSSFRV